MDRTLQTIGTILLVCILFVGIATLAQQFMGMDILREVQEGVGKLVGFMVPEANVSVEALNGATLISGTKTVHYYVENASGGTVDIARVSLTTDKAAKLVLEVKTDIANATISASIAKSNAIVVKEVEQVAADAYLLKLAIYPAFASEGATVPENVTGYTSKVEIIIKVDIPSGATGYVSVRVAEATYI